MGDTAYLKIEALHRRTREMPGQTARDRSAADELVGKERMMSKIRINLGYGLIRPAEAERRHSAPSPRARYRHLSRDRNCLSEG